MENIIKRIERIGNRGFVISIVYGNCGDKGPTYSVDVMSPDGTSLETPIAALSLEQSVDIAENEISKREGLNN